MEWLGSCLKNYEPLKVIRPESVKKESDRGMLINAKYNEENEKTVGTGDRG